MHSSSRRSHFSHSRTPRIQSDGRLHLDAHPRCMDATKPVFCTQARAREPRTPVYKCLMGNRRLCLCRDFPEHTTRGTLIALPALPNNCASCGALVPSIPERAGAHSSSPMATLQVRCRRLAFAGEGRSALQQRALQNESEPKTQVWSAGPQPVRRPQNGAGNARQNYEETWRAHAKRN